MYSETGAIEPLKTYPILKFSDSLSESFHILLNLFILYFRIIRIRISLDSCEGLLIIFKWYCYF